MCDRSVDGSNLDLDVDHFVESTLVGRSNARLVAGKGRETEIVRRVSTLTIGHGCRPYHFVLPFDVRVEQSRVVKVIGFLLPFLQVLDLFPVSHPALASEPRDWVNFRVDRSE